MAMEQPVEVAPKNGRSKSTIFEFQGERYYRCGNYWQNERSGRLHHNVWKTAHGPIPTGHHIHHRDGDRSNNQLENLELMDEFRHHSLHMSSSERKMASAANLVKHAVPAAAKWRHDNPEKASEMARRCAAATQEVANRTWDDFTCAYCSSTFRARRTYQKNRGKGGGPFCSRKCAAADRRKSGVDDIEKICFACGSTFHTNRYTPAKTCSRTCGQKRRQGNSLQSHG